LTYEEEILAKHSTPNLRRTELPRSAKKLIMEFDAQYNKMTKQDRDEFLDSIYPEEAENKEPPHDRADADVRRPDPAGGPGAEEAPAQADEKVAD